MWGESEVRPRRKVRTFLLDDRSYVNAVDRPALEAYEQYPEKKRAIIRLPLPFRKHRKLIHSSRETKNFYNSERLLSEFDEKDKKLVATPDAILGVHILELENVSLRVTNFDKTAPMLFYCLVSVGKKRKLTKVALTYTAERVRMDATLFFPIEVSNTRENYRNKLKFEIWAFQDPSTHFIIGTKEIHIYTLIQAVHSVDYCRIWAEGLHAVTLIYEYSFAYGIFGYGHSNQLRNTKSSIFESICHSMFPRIRLSDDDVVDNKFNIRIPKKVQLIGMSNFLLYTPAQAQGTKSKHTDDDPLEPKFFCLNHVEFDQGQPIYAKVNIKMPQEEFEADFNDMYGEYICISSRKQRLDFLHELLYGRLEDCRETEVGAIWQNLDFDAAENIIRADDNPQTLVYPTKVHCTEYPPAYAEPSDESFFQALPAVSRTPGWLLRMFGYESLKTDPHFGEPEYPAAHVRGYRKHRISGWQTCSHGLQYAWARVTRALLNFIRFLLPDLRSTSDIPDIAVTLPSPEGSTTDLFVSWVTDEREQFDYANATRRAADPVQEAYEAVNKLIYDEYEKDVQTEEKAKFLGNTNNESGDRGISRHHPYHKHGPYK